MQDRGCGNVPVQCSWEKIAPVVELCFHWRDLQLGLDNRYVADGVRSVQLEMACWEGGWMVAAGRRTSRLGWSRREMKLESCLGMTFSAGAAGALVVSGPRRRRVAGSIIMVWLGSQGEGGAGRWMDCAVSELRARNGRGRIPQSGGGQTVL